MTTPIPSEPRPALPPAARHAPREATRARQVERAAFWAGFKASAETVPGIFAWGIVSGMAMLKSGMDVWQALGMTLLVYSGSAQFAMLPLMVNHAPAMMIFVSAMIINLRFTIFAALMAPHFWNLPWYKRAWLGYFTGDIPVAYFPVRFPISTIPNPSGKSGYFTGIAYPSWLAWQFGSMLGILLASQIPENWNIGFAGIMALITIMIPMIINRAALAGAVTAAVVGVVAAGLPYRLGLLTAILSGMAAAMSVDAWKERRTA